MTTFPRTTVGGLSLSRLLVGTNWFLGYSHTTAAKDKFINGHVRDRQKIADILAVFFRAGVNTVMGLSQVSPLVEAIKEAEDRTGVEAILVSTPGLPFNATTPAQGFDLGEVQRILDIEQRNRARICMPHTSTTDPMVDRCTREIRQMAPVCRLIRERGMIPGLSTHLPETITYADETGLDVETYISIYNAMGFLIQ